MKMQLIFMSNEFSGLETNKDALPDGFSYYEIRRAKVDFRGISLSKTYLGP